MRIIGIVLAVAMPASVSAADTLDLARTVLGNSAVLKRGSDGCGDRLSLKTAEVIALTVAGDAAARALPVDQFASLSATAEANAARAAAAPGFCNKTAKRKTLLLEAVKRAGQRLITSRVLKL